MIRRAWQPTAPQGIQPPAKPTPPQPKPVFSPTRCFYLHVGSSYAALVGGFLLFMPDPTVARGASITLFVTSAGLDAATWVGCRRAAMHDRRGDRPEPQRSTELSGHK